MTQTKKHVLLGSYSALSKHRDTRQTAVKTILNKLLSLQKSKTSSVKDAIEVGDWGKQSSARGLHQAAACQSGALTGFVYVAWGAGGVGMGSRGQSPRTI